MPVVYQQYNLCICIKPQVSCPRFHLKHTFKIYFLMLRFLHKNAAVLSTLIHSKH